jgi:hypothetical protein
VKAWATHIQGFFPPYSEFQTETEFSDSNLSTGELNRLTNECKGIASVGSGAGVCKCPGGPS